MPAVGLPSMQSADHVTAERLVADEIRLAG
jgi:hypothetical protein